MAFQPNCLSPMYITEKKRFEAKNNQINVSIGFQKFEKQKK